MADDAVGSELKVSGICRQVRSRDVIARREPG